MNDDVRKDIEALRSFLVDDCIGFPHVIHTVLHKAADLIESLSAQLDQVTRERDAAVEDLKYVGKIDGTFCEICKHQPEEDCEKRKFENMDCFEWRGVEVEG